MSLNEISIEIVYQILMDLNYIDTINYCKAHLRMQDICQDDIFWKTKFIKHFSLIAYKYAQTYRQQNESWSDTYKRWEFNSTLDLKIYPLYSVFQNRDIILLHLDNGEYDMDKDRGLLTKIYIEAENYADPDIPEIIANDYWPISR